MGIRLIESSSLGTVSIDKPIKSSTNIQLNMFDTFNDIVNNQGQQKGNNEIFINIYMLNDFFVFGERHQHLLFEVPLP